MKLTDLQTSLLRWYEQQKRDLPWRRDRDPYRIWISEVMLQQTTVAAVIPFYERFMARFPDVATLAASPLPEVLAMWAGLGYYSRARNLHKAAALLAEQGFPRQADKLLPLPGFGPYTARAVTSIAFDEKVGVLDGNVIRVLSRLDGLDLPWWTPAARRQLQTRADQFAQVAAPHLLNQAMMELGATICTPSAPACLLCPWAKACVARKDQRIQDLPAKKPRRQREFWLWKAQLLQNGRKLAFVQNDYAPFLRGQLIFPGKVQRLQRAPKQFAYRHTITHHDIFVVLEKRQTNVGKDFTWIARQDISKRNPASLIAKALRLSDST